MFAKDWIGWNVHDVAKARGFTLPVTRQWLRSRGLTTVDSIVVPIVTPDEVRRDLDARRVDRDPCGWCGGRRDHGCRHHPHPAATLPTRGHGSLAGAAASSAAPVPCGGAG